MPKKGYNKSVDFASFAARLNDLITSNHVQKKDVTKELGSGKNTLSRYLKGERTPDLELVVRLSRLFNVSVDWLLGLSEDQTMIQGDDETTKLVELHNLASNDDKKVIRTILEKYDREGQA